MCLYSVWVNGEPVKVESARVSAYPLNKIWDGTQRSLDQTELAYYISAEICGASTVEVEFSNVIDSYEIRPHALGIESVRSGNRIIINVERPMQLCLEINGRHGALHIFLDPPSSLPDERNTIYFGPGEHKVDLLWLESDQTVYIDRGATVYGVIYAKNAKNVKISGRGVIDSSPYKRGNDPSSYKCEIADALLSRGFSEIDMKYYGNIVINGCENVLIEGVILKDAPLWALTVRNDSKNVVIDNVKLIGQWRYNSDGIDICTSKNVTVKNCFVRSFDDCIVARGAYLEGESGNVEDLVVENCVLWCDWGKSLEVWCGHKPTLIKNITFKDIYLVHLSAVAINITTWYGSENSVIDGVNYENIYVDLDGKYNSLEIESGAKKNYTSREGFLPRLVSVSVEKIGRMVDLGSQQIEKTDDYSQFDIKYRKINFNNVACIGEGEKLPVVFESITGIHKIENVRTSNCDFEVEIYEKEAVQ